MPAYIVVEHQGNVDSKFWIQEDVFRVGTGTNCKLVLQDTTLAAHLLTVEFRDGRYILHNRSGTSLTLDGKPFPTNLSSPWQANQALHITSDLILRLSIDGDLRPGTSKVTLATLNIEAPEQKVVVKEVSRPLTLEQKNTQHLQLLVIGICVVVVGVLSIKIMRNDEDLKPIMGQGSVTSSQLFETQVDSLAKIAGVDAESGEFRSLLQAARASELRGHSNTANRQYSEILLYSREKLAVLPKLAAADGDLKKRIETYYKLEKFAEQKLRPQRIEQ